MPARRCQHCATEHAVVKAYWLGVYEHVVIQDPALGQYVCELCRSCICSSCSKAFVAHPATWRTHLLFSSLGSSKTLCPSCQGALNGFDRSTAEKQAAYSRMVVERGPGPTSCPACLTAYAGWAQQQALAGPQGSRYPTDPLPQNLGQQQPQQQQQQQQGCAPGDPTLGHTTGWSWPGATVTTPPFDSHSHSSSSSSSSYPTIHKSTQVPGPWQSPLAGSISNSCLVGPGTVFEQHTAAPSSKQTPPAAEPRLRNPCSALEQPLYGTGPDSSLCALPLGSLSLSQAPTAEVYDQYPSAPAWPTDAACCATPAAAPSCSSSTVTLVSSAPTAAAYTTSAAGWQTDAWRTGAVTPAAEGLLSLLPAWSQSSGQQSAPYGSIVQAGGHSPRQGSVLEEDGLLKIVSDWKD